MITQPIRYTDLYLEIPASVLEISKLEIIEMPNEHGTALLAIKTLNEEAFSMIYNISPHEDIKIVAKAEDGEPRILFLGTATKIKISRKKDYYKAFLKLKSKTFAMDIRKRSRSFQFEDQPVVNLMRKVINEPAYYGISYDEAFADKPQREAFIQYLETDWEFVKRVASKFRLKMITDVTSPVPSIWFGTLYGDSYQERTNAFKLVKQSADFVKSQRNFGDWMIEEKTGYELQTTSEYRISDTVLFEDIELKVYQKTTKLHKGLLTFVYHLVKEAGFRADVLFNSKIIGAELKGQVLDVMWDRVKVHLHMDEQQPVDEAKWYKFETSYGANNKTGFYSMPKPGDEVFLKFPMERMEEGYVSSASRTDGAANSKCADPNVKYWGNTDKKEIMMAPNEIQVTASNGLVLINLDGAAGIEITSSGDINYHVASGEINGGRVNLRAGNEILVRTMNANIYVNGIIGMKATGGVSL